MRKAVIDVGSNSVLLLVEEREGSPVTRSQGGANGPAWRAVYEESAVTALGEGTKASGLLGETGMKASLEALASMFAKARELGCEEVVAAATMAVRIASNASEFLKRAEAQGTPVQVLSGDDEGRLGFEAVANDPLFSRFEALAIVDPGGHSTELIIARRDGSEWRREFLHSFAVGTLGLKSEAIPSESPGPMEILAASRRVDELLAMQELPSIQAPTIALGATGTNLISIREALPTWQPEKVHGAYLTFEEISRAVGWLMPLKDAERRAIVGMEPGRERTIHLGALILERFLHALHVEGCWVSVRGWRHALLEGSAKLEVGSLKSEV